MSATSLLEHFIVAVERLVRGHRGLARAAESFLGGLDATSQFFTNVFQKKSHHLLSQDKHFHCEMRFFAQSSGTLGLLRVQDLILDVLPTELKLLDAARSLLLQTATVLEFAGMGACSLYNTVMALVKSMAEQSVPHFQDATDTDFFMEVKITLTFFAQVKVNDFTEGTAREFCGTNAVLRQFTSIKAKNDKKIEIQLADLQVLIVFG